MKVLVLFAAAFAIASASFIGRKTVDVKEDGTIFIRGENGKQIMVSKQFGPYGQKVVEIEVTGPNTIAKKILIDDDNHVEITKDAKYQVPENFDESHSIEYQRFKRSSSYDVLDEIIREYQGVVDEDSYQRIINKIQAAVLNGQISKHVLDYLQSFNVEFNHLTPERQIYGQQTQLGDVLNMIYNSQKYGQGVYGKRMYNGFRNIVGMQGLYDEVVVSQVIKQILMKIFDREVLVNILSQQGFLAQKAFEHMPVEKIWDHILVYHGIFDRQILVELVNTPVLREILLQYGIFDKTAIEQFFYATQSQEKYNYVALERLINKSVLKYWLVKQGIFNKYWLEQLWNNPMYGSFQTSGVYAEQYLTKVLNNAGLRNFLVQYGIFDKYVLEKILFVYRTQGFYSQELLNQLVNKNALYNALLPYNINQSTIQYLVENEIKGLKVLLKYKFSQQTPKFSYKNLVGFVSQTPELLFDSGYDHPYGDEFVGIDFKKTVVRPFNKDFGLVGASFDNNRNKYSSNYGFVNTMLPEYVNKESNLKNILYGQQKYGNNREYNQGYYNDYQVTDYPKFDTRRKQL